MSMTHESGEIKGGDSNAGTMAEGGTPLAADVTQVVAVPVGGALRESVTLALEAKELSLTPRQERALMLLVAGQKRVEVAHAVGVSRQTLHKWMTKNAGFAVAYDTMVEDSLATSRARVASGLPTAADTVLRAIQTDAKLAYKMLSDAGVTTPREGNLNLEEVAARMEKAAKKIEWARWEKERDARVREEWERKRKQLDGKK